MANLAAANHYKKEHLMENWKVVENAKLYYISVSKTLYTININNKGMVLAGLGLLEREVGR